MPTISYSRDLQSESVRIITDFLSCGYLVRFKYTSPGGVIFYKLNHRRNGNYITVLTTAKLVQVRKNGKLRQTVCLPEKT